MGRKPAKRKLLKLTYATVKIPFLFVVCSLKASPCITKKMQTRGKFCYSENHQIFKIISLTPKWSWKVWTWLYMMSCQEEWNMYPLNQDPLQHANHNRLPSTSQCQGIYRQLCRKEDGGVYNFQEGVRRGINIVVINNYSTNACWIFFKKC